MGWFKQLKPWHKWGIIFLLVSTVLRGILWIVILFFNPEADSRFVLLAPEAPGVVLWRSLSSRESGISFLMFFLLFNTLFYYIVGMLLGAFVFAFRKVFSIFILLSVVFIVHPAFSYNIDTHQSITKKAFEISDLLTRVQDLHLTDSQLSDARKQTVSGAAFEDIPPPSEISPFRYTNHFHDPITDQGLTDGIDFSAKSARTWAISDPDNHWSWQRARQYYFDALSKSKKEDRDDSFAKMFRSIGQVVHLIQDMAVPAHVRNDNHGVTSVLSGISSRFDFFESIVERTVNPLNFSAASLSVVPNFPLSAFWDGETYHDSPLAQSNFTGLSEYTSYNFFSEDTLFKEDLPSTDKHYFPHPRKDLTTAALVEDAAEDGTTDLVYYVQGYDSVRLAAYSYFNRPLGDLGLLGAPGFVGLVPSGWAYHLDESVIRNNANILVPKAISYSAGLLNYFFRGRLKAQPWAAIIPDRTAAVLNVYHETLDEETGPGELILRVQYQHPTLGELNVLSEPIAVSSLPKSEKAAQKIMFAFNGIVPIIADDVKFTLVFRGQLGQESDAVMGYVFTPRLEHVFIVQETAAATGIYRSQDSYREYWSDGVHEVYNKTSREGGWDFDNQVLSGWFIAHGNIETIWASSGQLYINGSLVPNRLWRAQDSPDPPITWRMVLGNLGSDPVPQLRVTMADDTDYILELAHYAHSLQQNYKQWSEWPAGLRDEYGYVYGFFFDSVSTSVLQVHIGGLTRPQTYYDIFDTVTIGGFDPSSTANRRRREGSCIFEDGLFLNVGSVFYNSTIQCYAVDRESAEGFFNFYPVPASPTNRQSLYRRVYPPEELEFLESLGIEPVQYELRFQ